MQTNTFVNMSGILQEDGGWRTTSATGTTSTGTATGHTHSSTTSTARSFAGLLLSACCTVDS